MNLYLISLICKFFKVTFVSLITTFNISAMDVLNIKNINSNLNNDSSARATIIDYDTKYVYNSSVPKSEVNVIEQGVDGIMYNNTLVVQPKVDEVIEIGTAQVGKYEGRLTGYGPDCIGCSEAGNVSCPTLDKNWYSLKTNGIYYEDKDYGKVRILASSSYFPCGTIIYVSRKNYSFTAIVLDRGYDMNKAWNNGSVWFDLAYDTEALALSDGKNLGNNFSFEVKRWGW